MSYTAPQVSDVEYWCRDACEEACKLLHTYVIAFKFSKIHGLLKDLSHMFSLLELVL